MPTLLERWSRISSSKTEKREGWNLHPGLERGKDDAYGPDRLQEGSTQDPLQDAQQFLLSLFPEKQRGGYAKNSRKGFALELQIKDTLEQAGAYVIKAAASHGEWDLMAVVPDRFVLGIQAKYTKRKSYWKPPCSNFPGFISVLLRRINGGWEISFPKPKEVK